MATLFAISDLHVEHPDNREVIESLAPEQSDDWLIVAGDVADSLARVDWALGLLASRFERVIWVPVTVVAMIALWRAAPGAPDVPGEPAVA